MSALSPALRRLQAFMGEQGKAAVVGSLRSSEALLIKASRPKPPKTRIEAWFPLANSLVIDQQAMPQSMEWRVKYLNQVFKPTFPNSSCAQFKLELFAG